MKLYQTPHEERNIRLWIRKHDMMAKDNRKNVKVLPSVLSAQDTFKTGK